MKKVTLQTIADKFGISKVAVHKALTGKKGVSDKLRKEIVAYADSVHYKLKSAKVDVDNKRFIFFVNQDFFLTPSEQFYSTIFYFLSAECNRIGSTLQVAFLHQSNAIQTIQQATASFKPDGLFFVGQLDSDAMRHIRTLDVPTVFIDYHVPKGGVSSVYINHYDAGYRLTSYLIESGHEDIGFIGNTGSTSAIMDRYFGYRKALLQAGLAFRENRHLNSNVEQDNPNLTFQRENLPSAYVCHCDAAAQWLYAWLSSNGMRIPQDVSIVSFDDTMLCDSLLPRLTSLGPNKERFAKLAFHQMLELLRNPDNTSQTRLEPSLSTRESVLLLL